MASFRFRALGAGLVVLFSIAPAAAADDTVKCSAAQVRLAGQHSACLAKAEALAILKAEAIDNAKCDAKFAIKCGKIAEKYGSACVPQVDCPALSEAGTCVADQLPFPPPPTTTTTVTTTTLTTPTTTLAPDCDAPGDPDGDGFAVETGDCDECNAAINPGAYDFPLNGVDEDCDATADNAAESCDADLALADTDPLSAARVIELCQTTTMAGQTWGVLSAQYVRADGAAYSSTMQNGIMSTFGTNVAPKAGERLLVLSTGRARDANDAGACGSLTCANSGAGTAPTGFPQAVPGCPGATNINDDVALQVQLRVPTNAAGFRLRFDFYSFEYPEWVCTSYNDQYITLVNPTPAGGINGNVSFDSMGTPVSVNMSMQVCSGCPQGVAALSGTGFDTWDDAGATGWMASQAPVTPGSTITLRLAIWDAGDQAVDSTVLLDAFEWIEQGPVFVQTTPEP